MWHSDFHFYASIASGDGGYAGDVPLAVDWVPAVRLAEFEWRAVHTSALAANHGPVVIAPHRDDSTAPPFIDDVVITRNGDDDARVFIPRSYFADAVTA